MEYLGKKSSAPSWIVDNLREIPPHQRVMQWTNTDGVPTAFPNLSGALICGLTDLYDEVHLTRCDSLEDVQTQDELYGSGRMLRIQWFEYTGSSTLDRTS